tara:strand:- start:319 stop:2457 length:2139 start_codon:yes stop_codon:yes gene_type:complete
MSVRPQEVADEARRFTLRSIFATSAPTEAVDGADALPRSPTAPPSSQQQQMGVFAQGAWAPAATVSMSAAPPMQQQHGQLRFDLGDAHGAPVGHGPPLLPLTTAGGGANGGFKFTLPAMRAPGVGAGAGAGPAPRSIWSEGGANGMGGGGGGGAGGERKKLQAGYITGGFANANNPEIMRLNGVIDELQSKLKKSSERIATAEQSVARGNAALQSERATSHARIVALASEVKHAQHREVGMRAELASAPKLEDFDRAKFEMQARGAVELQASYDEELKRAEALQEIVDGMTAKHEAVLAEHAGLQTRLDDATAELSRLRDEQALVVSALSAAAEAEVEANVGADVQSDAVAATVPMESLDDHRARMRALALPVDVEGRRSDFLISTQAHEEAMADLKQALDAARRQILSHDALMTAERMKNAEADTIIKSLDLKLSSAREDTRVAQERHAKLEDFTMSVGVPMQETAARCTNSRLYKVGGGEGATEEATDGKGEAEEEEKAAATKAMLAERGLGGVGQAAKTTERPAVPERWVDEFQRYFALKQRAEHAAATVECAGTAATQRMIEDAMDAHACARRAYWCMVNDEPEPRGTLVGCCVSVGGDYADDDDDIVVDVDAIRTGLAISMNANAFQMGITVVAQDDCAVDFHTVPIATGRVTTSHTAEAVGLKMRTDKYVSAVSGDIKAKLLLQRRAWVKNATGEDLPSAETKASA